MKILIIGDTQLDSTPGYDRLDERGSSVRFLENQKLLADIITKGNAAGCKALLHLGDLTEMKNPNSLVMEASAKLFRQAIDLGMDVYCVAGNHDGAIFDVSSSSFAALSIAFGDRFHVAHTPTWWPKINVVALPYLHKRTKDEIREAVEQTLIRVGDQKEMPVLAMHYGASGAVVGPKNITIASDALLATDVHADQFSIIFAGHYHKHQELKLGRTEVCFPGSPYVCDMGERNDAKGYYIFDTETLEKTWYQTLEPQTRTWVQVEYPEAFDGLGDPWQVGNIVKVVGQVPNRLEVEQAISKQIREKALPEPFFIKFELTEAVEIATRGDDFVDLTIQQAIDKIVAERCSDLTPEQADKVKATIAENVRASSDPVFGENVYLVSVGAKNFMTYDDLSYSFAKEPVLISGENGLGKTNFSEACIFALTGEICKKVPKDNIVRQGNKEASVTLTLTNDRGDQLTIHRAIKKTTKGATQSVSVLVNGVNWSDGGVKEIQEKLNSFLGMTFNSLRSVNFLFQRDRDPFVFADPADRKKILGDILNQAPIQKAAKVLDKIRLEADRAVLTLDADVSTQRAFLAGMDEEALKVRLADLTGQEALKTFTAKEMRSKVESSAALVETAKATEDAIDAELRALPDIATLLATANGRLETATRTYDAVRNSKLDQFRSLKEKKEALAKELEVLPTLKTEVETKTAVLTAAEAEAKTKTEARANAQRAIAEIDEKISTVLGKMAKRSQTVVGQECEECGTPITAEHAKKDEAKLAEALAILNKDREKLDSAFKRAGDNLQTATSAVDKAKKDLTTALAILTACQTRLSTLPSIEADLGKVTAEGKQNKATYEASKASLEAEIEKLTIQASDNAVARQNLVSRATTARQNTLRLASDHAGLEASLRAAEAEIGGIQRDIQTVQQSLDKAKEVSAQISAKEAKLADLKEDQIIKNRANELVSAKGGLPVYLLDAQLPFLQSRANLYMARMGMGNLNIKLDTLAEDKETLLVLVDNGGQTPLDIAAFSGGQLNRVEICLKQALADLIASARATKLQFLFYDEPTDGLDENGKTALLDFLYDRSRERFATTMVVSHDPTLLHSFHNRLRVVRKSNGASTIEAC